MSLGIEVSNNKDILLTVNKKGDILYMYPHKVAYLEAKYLTDNISIHKLTLEQLLTNENVKFSAHSIVGKIMLKGTVTPLSDEYWNILLSENLSLSEIQHIDFRIITENAHDIMYLCDYKGYFVYVNPHAEKLIGFPIELGARVHFTQLIHQDYREATAAFYQNQFTNRISNTYFEVPISTKDGRTIWFGQNVTLLTKGEWVFGFQVIARDITETKRLSQALIKSEHRNTALLDAIPDSFMRVNTTGKILDFKHGISIISPFSTLSTGSSIVDIDLPEEIKTQLLRKIKRAISSDQTQVFNYEIKYHQDQSRYIEMRIVKSSSNEAICILRDFTEHKRTEFELISARKQAENSAREKENYLSVMSHEIRTPLNALIGLTNLMLEESPSKGQIEYLQGIKHSGENLLKVINDILDFSKIESHKIVLDISDFDLHDFIHSLVQTYKPVAGSQKSTLKLELDTATPKYVKGDSMRLNQVLTNLISNAIKFTKKGEITLSISAISEKIPNQLFTTLRFGIQDTGIGIPKERIPYIFESFTQANPNTTRKYGGTGLGLSIAKELVNLMGSEIHVESIPKKGTHFYFDITLPISNKKQKQISTAIDNDDEIQEVDSLSVLMVEDNEMNQLVLSRYLEKWGIKYQIASNGKEAIKACEKEHFDIILLDLELPKMNGYDTAINLRKKEKTADTPIIAITATISSESKEKAIQIGFNDYIIKPIHPKTLFTKIAYYAKLKQKNMAKEALPITKITKKGATSEMKNSGLIDLSYLVESSLQDVSHIRKMINLFIRNTPDYLKAFEKHIASESYDQLRKEAHKYKASVTIIGIKKAEQLITKAEQIINKQQDLQQLHSIFSELDEICSIACEELSRLLLSSNFENKVLSER